MAAETTYFVVVYDNLSGGSFTAKSDTLLTWDAAASSGFIITNFEVGTPGKMIVALYSGTIPDNNDTMTQGAVTADANGPAPSGNAELLLYPAYARDDFTVASSGAITWSGLALGATHSFRFDGQTTDVVVGEVLTFSGGQQCEVVTIVSDAGGSGELAVRWITNLDTFQFPDDNDTFTGDDTTPGDGALNGLVHPRAYSPLNLHRLLQDLSDDEIPISDDFLSIIDPTASERNTDQIIQLLGNVAITDTVAQHMYGGSIEQSGGDVLYSGVDLNITDPDGASNPVVILDDAIVTAYWENAYMPDSIAGRVRLMVKTREDGVDIDGKRITAKLLEYGDSYFTGQTVLGTGTTGLALFSTADGNNQTAAGTVAGAPYNTIVVTEGYQTIDYNNGNGAQPYVGKVDFGSASSAQTWERLKYIQRRGTAETLSSRNAQLYTGVTLNFAYDAESGNFSEDEVIAWGTIIAHGAETGGTFTVGNVVTGDTSGAVGRILYADSTGNVLIVAQDSGATPFNGTEGLTERSGGTATGVTATASSVTTNSNSGTGILLGLDDDGTTGNLYLQRTRGVAPADNQLVYGQTSLQNAAVNVTVQTRVVGGQCFFGTYTGSAYNPGNFGWGIDATDAIASDNFTDLLGATQVPPNNQTGTVTGLVAGDRIAVYPWDGTATDINGDPEPDFDETTLSSGLTGGVSTTAVVGTIPANTPATGFLRIERDSDGEYDLVPYSSWTGNTYTLVGTAPSTATAGNNVMRAFIDKVATSTSESYTAVQTGTNQVTIINRRGGVNPIKTFKGSATFGTAGFSAAVQRISDA